MQFYVEEDQELFERVEHMLGLSWSRDDLMSIRGGEEDGQSLDSPVMDKVRFPLSVIIRPEIIKDLRERFGLAVPPSPDNPSGNKKRMPWVPKDAQHMAFLPKDDFIYKIAGGEVPTNNTHTRSAGSQAASNPHFIPKKRT